jgi:potassium voltage-gated channel Shal-related subfamily D protein 2
MLGLNAEGEDNYLIAQGMGRDWKRRLFLLMEEPGSSREAFTIHVMSTGGILFRWVISMNQIDLYLWVWSGLTGVFWLWSNAGLLHSAVLTILSTLPSFHTNPGAGKALFGLDVMIVVLFTIEYVQSRTRQAATDWLQVDPLVALMLISWMFALR